MADPIRYAFTLTSYNSDQLSAQIAALGFPGYQGLCTSGQTVEALYAAALTPAQQTTLGQTVAAHVPAPIKVKRTILAIYTDLSALTAAQKTNVWADLSSGTPRKYLTDAGPNAASLAVLDWVVRFSGAAGANLTEAELRAAAMYTQDNPNYLVNPAFDPSVNVPGMA